MPESTDLASPTSTGNYSAKTARLKSRPKTRLKLQGRRQAVAFPDDVALLERLDAAEVPRTAAGPALAGKYQLRKRRSLKRTQNT